MPTDSRTTIFDVEKLKITNATCLSVTTEVNGGEYTHFVAIAFTDPIIKVEISYPSLNDAATAHSGEPRENRK